MQAAVLNDTTLSYRPDYLAQENDNLVEIDVIKAGICETDLQLVKGYMGFQGVLGHEFVGVAKSGKFKGQRVAGEINCACHECDTCRAGASNHCPHRTVLGILNHDGAFADQVWLPECNLHPIPDSISNDNAVFIEPLAAAFQIPNQLELDEFHQTVVLGDGRLGNLCAQVLHSLGQETLVIGKHSEKLERLSRLGIKTAKLGETIEERFADLVVDCTGSPTGLPTAFRFVRPRGTVVLKSTFAGETGPNLAPVVIDELNIVGSRCGPFPDAISALAENKIDVASLVTSRFPLQDVRQAFEIATQKNQLKVILDIATK